MMCEGKAAVSVWGGRLFLCMEGVCAGWKERTLGWWNERTPGLWKRVGPGAARPGGGLPSAFRPPPRAGGPCFSPPARKNVAPALIWGAGGLSPRGGAGRSPDTFFLAIPGLPARHPPRQWRRPRRPARRRAPSCGPRFRQRARARRSAWC